MKVKKLLIGLICFCVLIGFTHAQSLGDANGDGRIDIVDALVTARYFVGLNPQPFYPAQADVEGCDGTIDIIDALTIALYYIGIIDEFPCSQVLDSFTIIYSRSGGLAGIMEEIVIHSDEKTLSLNGRITELTDAEITLLWDALGVIDYSSLPNDIEPCCCDLFNYDVSISSTLPGINGRAVWTDCTEMNGQLPAELADLSALIRQLAQ